MLVLRAGVKLRLLSGPVRGCGVHTSANIKGGDHHRAEWESVPGNDWYPGAIHSEVCWDREMIAGRKVVGHGGVGMMVYSDHPMHFYPAITWRKWDEPEFVALRKKAEGDWRKMTNTEKRLLYRYNFCLNLAEMEAHEKMKYWKATIAVVGLGIFISSLMYLIEEVFVAQRLPIPPDYEPIYREYMMRKAIDRNISPIYGISSYWDRENDCWKK